MSVLLTEEMYLERFAGLVMETSWPEDSLLLAFSPSTWLFEQFGRNHAVFIAESTEGRIFSPDFEIRWRRMGHRNRVVFLGESPLPEGMEDCSGQLEGLVRKTRDIYLWGVRSDLEQEWLEQQVPQRFSYPLDGGAIQRGRISLVLEEWYDDTTGIPSFGRYHSIKETAGGTNAP